MRFVLFAVCFYVTSLFAEAPVLYVSHHCIYCRRIVKYVKRHKLKLPIRYFDQDPNAARDLRRLGGKGIPPALVIDNKEVIYYYHPVRNWLKRHKSQLRG